MLRNIMIVAKRDYIESVKTKAFLLGLVVAPILFGSSFLGIAFLRNKPDIAERRIAILDRTGIAAASVIESVRQINNRDLLDKATGRQTMPRYSFEADPPDHANPDEQRLALCRRIRPGDLYALVEIGSGAVRADFGKKKDPDNDVSWYSNETGPGAGRTWISGAINDGVRRVRLDQAGVARARFDDLLGGVNIRNMKLVTRDEHTGRVRAPENRNEIAAAVPLALVMMLFMIVMITSAPMLNAIAEDKLQRVFEMLLASVTPFDLIFGKVLAALWRSLTSSLLYIAGALLALSAMAMMGIAPIALLPWFAIYLIAEITMLSAIAAALGAACGSPQEAQSLGMLLFAPVLIPLLMIAPILQKPNGGLATAMSFFPPFTPIVMLLRQAMPGGVPTWQPWVGLVGMTLGVIAISWAAARIFRVAILMQGKPPSVAELARWAIRG